MQENIIEDVSLVFPREATPWWVWAAVVAGVIVGAILLVIWIKRRGKGVRTIPRIPAHVTARKRLEELRERLGGLRAAPFALEVSEILRMYVEERFDFRAAHQSTEEFLSDAEQASFLSQAQRQTLAEFLKVCDRAKFARLELEEKLKISLLETAERFVEETHGISSPAKKEGAVA